MKEYDLKKLLENQVLVNEKIKNFISNRLINKQRIDSEEIKGHILKAENNLRFVKDIIGKRYLDWALVGCYYSCYHIAIALIQSIGYTSKNHLATLCLIINNFYKEHLSKEDIEMLSNLFDYEDILFYVEAKNKREDATYSTRLLFDKNEVEKMRLKTILFVNKVKEIIDL